MDEKRWWRQRWGFSLLMLALLGFLTWRGWSTLVAFDKDAIAYLANSTTILVNVGLLYGVVFGGRAFFEWLFQMFAKALREAGRLAPILSSPPAPTAQAASAAVATTVATAAPPPSSTTEDSLGATPPPDQRPASSSVPSSPPQGRRQLPIVGVLGILALVIVTWWLQQPALRSTTSSTPQERVTHAPRTAPPAAMPSYCSEATDTLSCRLDSGKALWDIARDCYGNPFRANELWEINRGRFPGRTERQIPQGADIIMTSACDAVAR